MYPALPLLRLEQFAFVQPHESPAYRYLSGHSPSEPFPAFHSVSDAIGCRRRRGTAWVARTSEQESWSPIAGEVQELHNNKSKVGRKSSWSHLHTGNCTWSTSWSHLPTPAQLSNIELAIIHEPACLTVSTAPSLLRHNTAISTARSAAPFQHLTHPALFCPIQYTHPPTLSTPAHHECSSR